MADKETIRRNFSRCARSYDRYCGTQRRVGEMLINEAEDFSCRRILEIGCGTGNYTLLLREKFPEAEIEAVDISPEMIRIARQKCGREKTAFSIADGETIAGEEEFDLITGNAALQWLGDAETATARYRELLRDNGTVLFSFFGPGTFRELKETFSVVFGKRTALAADGFREKKELEETFARHFSGVAVKEKKLEKEYSGLYDLLRRIKLTGERGEGLGGKVFLTRRELRKGEEVYRDLFGKIKVTYQVFLVKGRKRTG